MEVGRVSGLMCSENAVNSQPTCANHWAMTTVARESWGFDGYVTGPHDHRLPTDLNMIDY